MSNTRKRYHGKKNTTQRKSKTSKMMEQVNLYDLIGGFNLRKLIIQLHMLTWNYLLG